MSDHTPEPWVNYHPTQDMITLSAADYARARACVNACAGIPTEQLGNVADLLKAAKLGPQYMALAHSDALNDKKPELAKIAKLDYETAMAGIKPFVED